jgi:hypothetical protein
VAPLLAFRLTPFERRWTLVPCAGRDADSSADVIIALIVCLFIGLDPIFETGAAYDTAAAQP